MPLQPGTKIGPYEILAPLGFGGMGEVYRARDSKLEREVAVKVLPPKFTSDPDALGRFEREAKAVAALSHPNILAIFDFGSHDGVSYAVTELLRGETLSGKIASGLVSRKQAIDWSLQVAQGLSAAHGRGVVHRDLKPDNVFVTDDGHVKILDFGLAKRVDDVGEDDETSAPTNEGHTEPGTVMGTLSYMSPEQLRGQPVDRRSDIFSFGAILYELLSGHKAFKRDTPSDTIAAILKEEIPELTQSGRNVSPALDHVVRHCLEKERENRFQSAKDVAFALSEASAPVAAASGAQRVAGRLPKRKLRIAAAAFVVVAASAGVVVWTRHASGGGAAAAPRRIAVLPFENLGAPEDDYFADGISDEVRAKLTTLPGIEVLARGSSRPYKKSTKSPQEIARELSASFLLTATVRWQKSGDGSRVQVIPELVEIRGDAPPSSKWQEPFDAALTDVFQVQSDIASRVAQALGIALAAKDEKSLAERPTASLAAYDAFLRGEEASSSLARTDLPSVHRALPFYEQAVALDPSFVQAWARIGYGNALLYSNGVPRPDLDARAREAAEKAAALTSGRADGQRALGDYYRLVKRDSARALEYFDKAVMLSPRDADAIAARGRAELMMGKLDAALPDLLEATRRDPRSVSITRTYADTLIRAGRRAEGRSILERLIELDPKNLSALLFEVMSYLGEGDLAAARRVIAEGSARLNPPEVVAYLATYYDLTWVLDADQLGILRRLTPVAFDGDAATCALAQTQAAWQAGDAAQVREYAEKAVTANDEQLATSPDDAQLHGARGLALAFAGRRAEAVAAGERAVAISGPEKDMQTGPFLLYTLARIHSLNGDADRAIDALQRLLNVPGFVKPGWLRIDPYFAALRTNPRFRKLVAERERTY